MSLTSKFSRSVSLALGCAVFLSFAISAQAGPTINWENQTWTITNGSATVDTNTNSLTLTSTSAGDAYLHVNRILPAGTGGSGSFLNDNGTPWVQFTYIDNTASTLKGTQGIDLFIEQEGSKTVADPDVRVQAGSLFGYAGIGWARYNYDPEQQVFATGTGSAGTTHTVYIGKLSDGTINFVFDGTSYLSTYLKNQVGTAFNFNDVYLRLRKSNAGGTAVFTSFTYGANAVAPVPEPATLVSAGFACLVGIGFGLRRRKLAKLAS